jgi:hypothetical protein
LDEVRANIIDALEGCLAAREESALEEFTEGLWNSPKVLLSLRPPPLLYPSVES